MFVSLSTTLKTFKFLTLLEARAATTKGGGESKGAVPPKQRDSVHKIQSIKFIAITEARSISCSDLTVKNSVGSGDEHLQNYLFL